MGVEDFRTLLRAYVALTLARSTAEFYGGAEDAPHPYMTVAVKYQDLALRELESLLDEAQLNAPHATTLPLDEEVYPALVM